ncbi:putative reverse transcriptase domain-containing protein [Tanacetum coccineum]
MCRGKKVKFVAATLEGPSLTWWKTKVATMGLETVNQMSWTEMKQMMTAEFCPIEEVQRMEHELWNLKLKEYDVVACCWLDTQELKERKCAKRMLHGVLADGNLPLCENDVITHHVGQCTGLSGSQVNGKLGIIIYKTMIVEIESYTEIELVYEDLNVITDRYKALSSTMQSYHLCSFRVSRPVFPEEFPGLPPPRQVKFRIDLVA